MGVQVRFGEEDWARIERDWSAWWAGELDRPMVMIEGWETPPGVKLPDAPHFVPQLPPDLPPEEVVDRYLAHLAARRYYGDAWPRWWVNFGPGILAAFVGANLTVDSRTVWFDLPDKRDTADLHPRYDPDNVWWRRVRELTRTAVRRWGGTACVGITDLGGNLDILASLRGTQRLLLDLHDAPEEVDRLVRQINRLWLRYYDELVAIIRTGGRGTTPWAPIWSPGRCYMLQSDFSYMISPAMFERFVLPDLAGCCEAMDHGFYHLDGKGQLPHLDMLLSLRRLRGIQWIPGDGQPPPEEWMDVLERIRDGGKLCQLFVTPDGARKIVRELGGKGFALCIHQWTPKSRQEAEELLRELIPEGASP